MPHPDYPAQNHFPVGALACLVVSMTILVGCSQSTRLQQKEDLAIWKQRILESIPKHLQRSRASQVSRGDRLLCQSAAMSLAAAGFDADAMQVAKSSHGADIIHVAQLFIADGQATAGRLDAALHTVQSIDHNWGHDRTLSLVAARMAQRGEFEIATKLLAQINNPPDVHSTRKIIASAMLEAGKFGQAIAQYRLLSDTEQASALRFKFQRIRNEVSPDHEDFVDMMIRLEHGEYGNLSDIEKTILRIRLLLQQSQLRATEPDLAREFQHAQSLLSSEQQNNFIARIDLTKLLHKAGMQEQAHSLATDLLAELGKLKSIDVLDEAFFELVAITLHNRIAVLVDVLSSTELIDATRTLASLGENVNLLSSLGEAMARANEMKLCENAYQKLTTDFDRVRFATGVLFGKSTPATPYTPSRPPNYVRQRQEFDDLIDKILLDETLTVH